MLQGQICEVLVSLSTETIRDAKHLNMQEKYLARILVFTYAPKWKVNFSLENLEFRVWTYAVHQKVTILTGNDNTESLITVFLYNSLLQFYIEVHLR